jgi:sugar phosphate isomerase/epimerase
VEWRVVDIPDERRSEAPSFWGNNLCTFPLDVAQAEEAGRLAHEAGLEVVGLGTYLDVGNLAGVEAAMQFAQICGAKQIRVSPGHWRAGMNYAECFDKAVDFWTDVEALAKQYGIRAVVEIHQNTIAPSASAAYRLVSKFDPAHVGVIHDAGNMVCEGYEDYRLGLQLLGPYLHHVHIKNTGFRRPDGGGIWESYWGPIDDGVVNWHNLFAALDEAGYDGWLGLENFSASRPTRETLRYDIAFLKNILDSR